MNLFWRANRVGLSACIASAAFAFLIAAAALASPPQNEYPTTKLKVEVTGGDQSKPVNEASVYVKFVLKDKFREMKDTKYELNVKTNKEGIASVAAVPRGKVTIQIVAPGWKPFGQIYDISDDEQTVKIHLDKPPRWY